MKMHENISNSSNKKKHDLENAFKVQFNSSEHDFVNKTKIQLNYANIICIHKVYNYKMKKNNNKQMLLLLLFQHCIKTNTENNGLKVFETSLSGLHLTNSKETC